MAASGPIYHCLLSIGSNLGQPAEMVQQAASLLEEHACMVHTQLSSLHATQPIGGPSGQAEFVNAAILARTIASPHEVLAVIHEIEKKLGRTRDQRWQARTIDMDLLLYEQQQMQTSELQIPHPRMSFRPFVLAPAVELASDWVHPLIGKSLIELWHLLHQASDHVCLLGLSAEMQSRVGDIMAACAPGLHYAPVTQATESSAKLTISAGPPSTLAGGGPTLWVEETWTTELLQQEISAAVQCVWPAD